MSGVAGERMQIIGMLINAATDPKCPPAARTGLESMALIIARGLHVDPALPPPPGCCLRSGVLFVGNLSIAGMLPELLRRAAEAHQQIDSSERGQS